MRSADGKRFHPLAMKQSGVSAVKTLGALVALIWCCLACGPFLASAQTLEQGIDLLNEAVKLDEAARSKEDIGKVIQMYLEALRIFRNLGFKPGVGGVANNLGVVYMNQGDYPKAAEQYKSALAFFEAEGDKPRQTQVLTNLCIIHKDLGKLQEAISYGKRALDMTKENPNLRVKGQILNALGNVYEESARYGEAGSHYRNALAIWEAIDDSRGEAITLNNLGAICFNLGRYGEAADCCKRSFTVSSRLGDRRQMGIALSNLGSFARRSGQYAEAVKYYKESVATSKELGDLTLQVKNLNNLGNIYWEWGQYSKAVECYDQTLTTGLQSQSPTIQGAAFQNLGGVHADWGLHSQAMENYSKALAIWVKVGHPKGQAKTLVGLGEALDNTGRHDEALARFKESLSIQEQIGADTASINATIGHFYLDRNAVILAEPFAIKSKSDSALARLHLLKRDYDTARSLYRALHAQAEKTGKVGDLFVACTGLGLVYEGMEDYPEAAHHFRRAVELTEDLRSSLPRAHRRNFFDVRTRGFTRTDPYKGLARVLLRLNRADDAIKCSEFTKARVFADYFSQRAWRMDYGASPDLMSKDEELADRMAALKKLRQQAYEQGNQDAIRGVQHRMRDLEAQFTSYVTMLREKSPLYAAARYPQPMDLSQTALREDELVLAYDVSDSGLLTYLLKGRKVIKAQFKSLPREELDDLVLRFRQPFEGVTRANLPDKLRSFDFTAGKKLADVLLRDIIADIPEGEHVMVVPDDFLGVLPFEMLVLDDGGRIVSDKGSLPYVEGARFLGDRNRVSYYQSVTALTLSRRFAREERQRGQRLLVMADPVFQMADKRAENKRLERRGLSQAERKLLEDLVFMITAEEEQSGGHRYKRLRTTEELALRLGELFGSQADVFTGLSASKGVFLGEISSRLDNYGQIVFATHGDFTKDLPGIREPVLVLTTVPPGTDGFLRLSEVVNLKMNADVVALTACKSGLGRKVSGEGILGMGRAFQFAGAKSVLMSLWSVEEKSSVKLVESFFRHMKQGKSKLEALRLARSEIRQAGYDHPFFWASFILVGETGLEATKARSTR